MISYSHQNNLENRLLAMQILLRALALEVIGKCTFFLELIIYGSQKNYHDDLYHGH